MPRRPARLLLAVWVGLSAPRLIAADGEGESGTCSAADPESCAPPVLGAPWQAELDRHMRKELWKNASSCSLEALSSAPALAVSFGLGMVWEQVLQRRTAAKRTSEPLEIHIPGAAYPFEGRGAWKILAEHLAPYVPSVRVVLILGTPDHFDHVPEEQDGRVYIGDPRGSHQECFNVEDFGEGDLDAHDICGAKSDKLEVLCEESLYQGVADKYPQADLVFMFSPGLGQVTRRSWDIVLLDVLQDAVPLVVCDMLRVGSEKDADRDAADTLVPPGGVWRVRADSEDDQATKITLNAYGARYLGARRSPFPLRSTLDEMAIVKNAVIQAFHGYLEGATPVEEPPEKLSTADEKLTGKMLENLRTLGVIPDETAFEEWEQSLSIPVSVAYDAASLEVLQTGLALLAQGDQEDDDPDDDPEKLTKAKRDTMHALSQAKYTVGMRGVSKFFADLVEGELGNQLGNLL